MLSKSFYTEPESFMNILNLERCFSKITFDHFFVFWYHWIWKRYVVINIIQNYIYCLGGWNICK